MAVSPSGAARWLAVFMVLVSSIGCDQATKRLAQEQLKGRPPRSFAGDLLRLEYAENPGAFLGLGGAMPPVARWLMLTGINGVLVVVIGGAIVFHRPWPPASLLAVTLLWSGAVGNLIDRLQFDGLVIDFLNIGVGPLRTGIFNVADMAISGGAVLLVYLMWSRSESRGQLDA